MHPGLNKVNHDIKKFKEVDYGWKGVKKLKEQNAN